MICPTALCTNPGKRVNHGWCDACSFDIECGLERNRDDAARLATQTGKPWILVESHPTSRVQQRARKLGKVAYGAYPGHHAPAMLADGYRIVETLQP